MPKNRRKSSHIYFDKIYDGITYHHTGYEVQFDTSIWWAEYRSDDGDILYF